jgi:hypothetical protein
MAETYVMNDAMLISGIVLAFTFVGIFTEHLHGFHRAKFAMLGAILMIIIGQYSTTAFMIPSWPLRPWIGMSFFYWGA